MTEPVLVRAHQLKADGTLGAVIPKPIREKLHITKGTRLLAYEEGGRVILRRLDSLKGYAEESDPAARGDSPSSVRP